MQSVCILITASVQQESETSQQGKAILGWVHPHFWRTPLKAAVKTGNGYAGLNVTEAGWLTVITTLRQQERNVLDHLTAVYTLVSQEGDSLCAASPQGAL